MKYLDWLTRPAFLDRLDKYLLRRVPMIWSSQIHYVLWWTSLVLLLMVGLIFILPLHTASVPKVIPLSNIVVLLICIPFTWWLPQQTRFKEPGNLADPPFYDVGRYLVYALCAAFAAVPYLFFQGMSARIAHLISERQFLEDVNRLADRNFVTICLKPEEVEGDVFLELVQKYQNRFAPEQLDALLSSSIDDKDYEDRGTLRREVKANVFEIQRAKYVWGSRWKNVFLNPATLIYAACVFYLPIFIILYRYSAHRYVYALLGFTAAYVVIVQYVVRGMYGEVGFDDPEFGISEDEGFSAISIYRNTYTWFFVLSFLSFLFHRSQRYSQRAMFSLACFVICVVFIGPISNALDDGAWPGFTKSLLFWKKTQPDPEPESPPPDENQEYVEYEHVKPYTFIRAATFARGVAKEPHYEIKQWDYEAPWRMFKGVAIFLVLSPFLRKKFLHLQSLPGAQ